MRIAMLLTAAAATGIGWFPDHLYALLPYAMDYQPYTPDHVLAKTQLLVFAALAFALSLRMGLFPRNLRAVHLDTDWLYRHLAPQAVHAANRGLAHSRQTLAHLAHRAGTVGAAGLRILAGPAGLFNKTWSTGAMVLWAAILLGIYLVVYYLH
jgi:multicomponent Na+:H+ antiporter subunit D